MTHAPRPETIAPREAVPPAPALRSVDDLVISLRRLAVAALDAGHAMPAVRIAGLADQLEAETAPRIPPRPDYRGR